MLHAVAGEESHGAVIHAHREVDRQLALRQAQGGADAGVDVQPIGGGLELAQRDGPEIGLFALWQIVPHNRLLLRVHYRANTLCAPTGVWNQARNQT